MFFSQNFIPSIAGLCWYVQNSTYYTIVLSVNLHVRWFQDNFWNITVDSSKSVDKLLYSTTQLICLPSPATCWVHRESNPRPTYWGHWSQDHSPQVGCSRHARPSLLCPWLPVAGSRHTGGPHMTLLGVPLTSSRRGKTRMFPWHKVIGLLAMGTLLDQALCPLEIS